MSTSTFAEVKNEVRIQVRGRDGRLMPMDLQVVKNTTMPTIEALAEHLVKLESESARLGYDVWQAKFFIRRFETSTDGAQTRRQYTEKDIAPIMIDGRIFKPIFWGSAAKKGALIYYDQDIAVDLGFIQFSEDAGRVSRAWLPRGDNGSMQGQFNVLIVEPGTEINGWLVEDGYGLFDRDAYQSTIHYGREAHLGHSSTMTASFFLELQWDKLRHLPLLNKRTRKDIIAHIEAVCGPTPDVCGYDSETCSPIIKEQGEVEELVWYTQALAEYDAIFHNYVVAWHDEIDQESPLFKEMKDDIDASLEFINAPKWNDLVASGGSRQAHDLLVAADKIMGYHPWMTSTISKYAAALRTRTAQAPQLKSYVYVAVPSVPGTTAIWPEQYEVNGQSVADSTAIINGQPISNIGAIQVVEDVVRTGPVADRIAELEVAQYSFTAHDLSASFKGQVGLVSSDDMTVNGVHYDAILCTDDSKVGRKFKQYKVAGAYTINGTFVFVRVWGKGSAFGIDAYFWKHMGKDHDGDNIFVMPGSRYPLICAQIKAWRERKIEKIKLEKTKTPITSIQDMRPYQAAASMLNLVGNITNARQVVYSLPEHEREALAALSGYKSVEGFYAHMDLIHQLGEDIFKTSWKNTERKDVRPNVLMILAQISWASAMVNNAKSKFGAGANHTNWKGDQYAFRSRVPEVGILHDIAASEADPEMHDWVLKTGIDYSVRGFVAPYQRFVLPQIMTDVTLEVKPLSHFENFGYPAPTAELGSMMRYFNTAYKAAIARTNQMSPDDWNTFTGDWGEKLDKLVKDIQKTDSAITRYDICCWLWYESHHNQDTGGSIVMALALPEAVRIVSEKPGQQRQANLRQLNRVVAEINVISPAYQFETLVDTLDFNCAIVEFMAPARDNRSTMRRAIVNTGDMLPGQKQPGEGYPANMVALIDKQNEGQVQPGVYRCNIRREGKVWRARLFAVSAS